MLHPTTRRRWVNAHTALVAGMLDSGVREELAMSAQNFEDGNFRATAELDSAAIDSLTASFPTDRANRAARNAVCSLNVTEAAVDRARARSYHDTFGIELKSAKTVTGQRHSGRCWIFAATNVARSHTLSILDVDDFELSQNYVQFYDKLERANSRLEYIIETADRPWLDRQVSQLMLTPLDDGGQFMFCANIINKWGVVPKDEMPDTACSKDTSQMNVLLTKLFRKDATVLRRAYAEGKNINELRAMKREMLGDFHRILCCCLGEPPLRFNFCCEVGANADVDKSKVTLSSSPNGGPRKQILRDFDVTPQEFASRYVRLDPAEYVELTNFPGESRPYRHAYGVRYFDPVIGGQPLRFLNMPIEYLEKAAVASLKAGVPVFMMCDVGQNLARKDPDFSGVLSLDCMDAGGLFGVDMSQSKADMIDNRECGMTHCMTFQGVELDSEERPISWRVENSWGDDFGAQGYIVMTSDWFRMYGGDVVIERRFVSSDVLNLWDSLPLEQTDYWGGLLAIK
jgi:bleomycin hydrolase